MYEYFWPSTLNPSLMLVLHSAVQNCLSSHFIIYLVCSDIINCIVPLKRLGWGFPSFRHQLIQVAFATIPARLLTLACPYMPIDGMTTSSHIYSLHLFTYNFKSKAKYCLY